MIWSIEPCKQASDPSLPLWLYLSGLYRGVSQWWVAGVAFRVVWVARLAVGASRAEGWFRFSDEGCGEGPSSSVEACYKGECSMLQPSLTGSFQQQPQPQPHCNALLTATPLQCSHNAVSLGGCFVFQSGSGHTL